MISSTIRMSILALALAFAATGPAVAQKTFNLTVGAPLPDRFAPVAAIKNYFVPGVSRRLAEKGKYKINWREAYGGQLYKSNASITSLQDGIADFGMVFTAVEGSRLPLSQVSAYAPGATDDNRVMTRVINELMETYPPLKAEWDRNGIMAFGAATPDSIQLFTKFEVRRIEDIKNRKISAIGSIGSWLKALGGVPVSSPLPRMYNDVKTGLTDGALTVPSLILAVKLYEVAPYVTLLDMGGFNASSLAVSKRSFAKLPAEVREVIRDVGKGYSAAATEAFRRSNAAAFKLFREKGPNLNPPVRITEPSKEELVRMYKSMPNIARAWAKRVEASGAPGSQILAAYMDTMRKHGAKPMRHWDRE